MSTCRWCTPGCTVTAELLKSYAAKDLENDFDSVNDDLSYCMECVVEYHKARDEAPQLHKSLWALETSRLIAQLEKAMHEEIEDDDELYVVEEDGEKQVHGYSGFSFESNVRVPLLEILRFPYLLLNKHVGELCIEALCKMEHVNNTFQVYEKLPGIYLLLVHPNETIRRWAILTARAQGKVDRDDYYDLEEVFTCLFKVIELGLFENPDIYMYTEVEDGKLILLPPHLYDTSNYKNYWLGICMLLTVLEEQAMASLLLGPNKQNDFMQSILHIMEKQTEDESTTPFWPALHCFMTILDRLGSKVWGQLIDPIQAFRTIISNPSYNSEIENIRKSSLRRTKCEPDPDDNDMVTCSQAVYSFNTEKAKKETGWKSAICPDYCPNMYEDMQCLANILQSDIGQDMRVHNSTFLWFIPYVQSVMDLKDLGVAYILEVIHHLYSEIKIVFNQASSQFDKVTEFFVRVLVSVIELHRSRNCLHYLWISSHTWVEAIVKCALLPNTTSMVSSSPTSPTSSSVQFACMQLIRSLLREGCQLGQQATFKQYLDKFNLIIRGNVIRNLDLSKREVQELQSCLTQIIKSIKDKISNVPGSPSDQNPPSLAQTVPFIKTERMDDECYGSIPTSPVFSSDAPMHPLERREQFKNHIKTEPPEYIQSDAEYNYSVPSCSSHLKTHIKKETLDDTSTVISDQKGLGKLRTGWQANLFEVMAKVPRLKPNAVSNMSESKITSSEGTFNPPQDACIGMNEKEKDLLLKAKSDSIENESPDLSDSDDENIIKDHPQERQQTVPDNLPVSEKLKRLSLDNNQITRPIKKKRIPWVGSSRFVESNTDSVMDSETDDDDDAVPLSVVKKKLLKKKSKNSGSTYKQVDRRCNSLATLAQTKSRSCSVGSFQHVSDVSEFCSIKRKVKEATRSLDKDDNFHKTDLNDQIITISDDTDKEEESLCNSVKVEKQDAGQEASENPIHRPEQIKPEPDFVDYDSQCFEFETDDDVYSVWEDSQYNEMKLGAEENQSLKQEPNYTEDYDPSNELKWGYDTDYVSDELIEQAAKDAEQQFKASTANTQSTKEPNVNKSSCEGVKSSSFYGKRSQELFTEMGSKSKQPKLTKEHAKSRTREALVTAKKSLTVKRNKSKSPLKDQGHVRKNGSPGKVSLAVLPPKKIHKCPEPTSAVEKLRLKKVPRKAFDLSQRSLDSLAELRNYGKSAGYVETKKPKSKLISPQSLLVKGNKKLLACQDRQFYRQSRPKDTEKRRSSSDPENRKNLESRKRNAGVPRNESAHKPGDQTSLPGELNREEKTESPKKQTRGGSLVDANKPYESSSKIVKDTETDHQLVNKLGPQSRSLEEDNVQFSRPATVPDSDEHDEDENLFLTQADPLDMDLCSQLESEIDVGVPQDMSSSSVNDHSPVDPPHVTEASKCSFKNCIELTTVSSDKCLVHSVPEKKDHVFARPGLPPSLQKPPRPSTTKIYSSGTTSRTASLTKDIESLPKLIPTAKTKSQALRPLLPSPALLPPALNKLPLHQNARNVQKPPTNQNNIPIQCNASAFQKIEQRDQNWLMKEVLKWNFDMFDNNAKFGPPNQLCQLPLSKVPLKFSSYAEYFDVFCPLMLLNTFESLAQEWATRPRQLCKLSMKRFCLEGQMMRGEFQVWIRNMDLNMQWLPKEGDLVFLVVPFSPGTSPTEEPPSVSRFTGHVSRFIRTQQTQNFEKEQYTLCELNIQTYGNISPYCNQQVQCVVIGSLITTQRQFKALTQLQKSPLFKPIIYPTPNDFLPNGMITYSDNLMEYNNDQRKAIENAYAMMTQYVQRRLPKICMIHGPPGSGKSKTIVGLLYRILMEQSNVPNQNLNAKNKRNRVLVCAPSNAALDDLMKKIILEFKDKCRDKKNTLGNCGDINLVRLGSEKTISSDVVKFSLDCQVNHRINRAAQDPAVLKQKEVLDRELDDLSCRRAMEMCNKKTCEELDQRIAKLTKERQLISNALKQQSRKPQEVQRSIILESHIICCTLSTSGGFLLESAFRQLGQEPFTCVIVDEAGQSCEVETLIPLLHRCCKLVLAGDPEQLPPTVISMKAEELGYGQSMMSRLCQILESSGTSAPISKLTIQYRMHPDICLFPSKNFYNSVLKTDRATEEARCASDWPFQPYIVFDVTDGIEEKEMGSFSNPQEIKIVVDLIKLIKSKKRELSQRHIGIITPYRAQKTRIVSELKKTFGENSMPSEVDTVDGFQGREKDCIIVTCVRANSIQGFIGFLASRQRLNVTITRAKKSLFILGSLRTLMENKDWNLLIQDAHRRGALFKTKEKSYQTDVKRILKVNPLVQRAASVPPTKAVEMHKVSLPPTFPVEASCRGMANDPPPVKTISHPNNYRLQNNSRYFPGSERKVPSNAGPPPSTLASSGRLRDPRLERRTEETKDNTRPPDLQPGSDTNRSQSHSYHNPSLSVAGVKRPSQSSGRDPWPRQPQNDRESNCQRGKHQDPKKRKLS